MAEYIENGARLGWLFAPELRRVYVYRSANPVVELDDVADVSADPELPGFTLDLSDIWEPNI